MNKLILLFAAFIMFPVLACAQTAGDKMLYAPTTPVYLAKSYWLLNGLDVSNNENLDQYLMMTECDLYKQFFSNDIEWDKIREATRSYISANKESFPRRFEFIQPVYLDRYDSQKGIFSLRPISQMAGIKSLQISGNDIGDNLCLLSEKYNPEIFPLNAVVTISRPINYTGIKTSQANAEEYLKNLGEKNAADENGRIAYVRYRFKVEQSLPPIKVDREITANFFGTLESMTVFGDKDLFIKLEDVKF